MTNPCIVHWFRQDLRLADNPGLAHAAANGAVLPVYILDDDNAAAHKMGGASRWWLHQSLNALNHALDGRLVILAGDAAQLLPALARDCGATMVTWNRAYEPWRIDRDSRIKATLTESGIAADSFNASLLWEPWRVLKDDGTPYRVFTPFYRRGCLKALPPRQPLPLPSPLDLVRDAGCPQGQGAIDNLGLLPDLHWINGLDESWAVGESAAKDRLSAFLDEGLAGYKQGRNFPARRHVSRLSPYLHWGEISPNTVWYAVRDQIDIGACPESDGDHFLSELGWREFSHSLLYHFPDLPSKNLQPRFDHFDWRDDPVALARWQQGMTGYPIVDAAMRELWQTGTMHNRVRMIVGSFLVKNLLIHWRRGFEWFWDCLFDANLANNSFGWQWIAGSGADAAPYFRIFNPILQGKKFDADGHYTRRYVPELSAMPNRYLFNPWEAPKSVLGQAGITLGVHYPRPVVSVDHSRREALAAFGSL